MVRLPPISGDIWFNNNFSKEVDIKNRIVLIDFWTYTCVNCLRTLPYLKQWWQKYKDQGFVIIGIHTPEFEFEKNPLNVSQAIKDLEIKWPIVLDNNYVNWTNFANKYWPAKYLADHTGQIIYEHFGEGNYEETENFIQKLIKNVKNDIVLPQITVSETGKICYLSTPETYCGYLRGNVANPFGLVPDSEFYYSLLDDPPANSLALRGSFISRPEFLESKNSDSEILLHFEASEVNLVLSPADSTNTTVQVLLNYNLVPQGLRGSDLNDTSEIEITESKMYQLIKSNTFFEGILSIRPKKNNFKAYAFTFSGCID